MIHVNLLMSSVRDKNKVKKINRVVDGEKKNTES